MPISLVTKTAFLATIMAIVIPGTAPAQAAPPPPMGANGSHHMSDADRAQMMQLHDQARATILASLTPEHKTLLSSVVGALAVAAQPDAAAAAAQLDAALTPAEKQAIAGAAATMHQHMKAMMPAPVPSPMSAKSETMPTDPGELLLMMSAMSMMGPTGMMHTMSH